MSDTNEVQLVEQREAERKQHEAEFGKDFRGPVPDEERRCTDPVFSVLFFLFWVGMLAVGATAISSANSIGGVTRQLNGYQLDGKICGIDGDYGAGADYKYLYYFQPDFSVAASSTTLLGLCVKECPAARGDEIKGRLEDMDGNSVDFTSVAAYSSTASDYATYCLPPTNATEMLPSGVNSGLQDVLLEVQDASGAIWGSLGFSVLFACLFLVFIYYCIGPAVAVSIVCSLASMIFMGYCFYFLATCTEANAETHRDCGTYSDNQVTGFWIGAALFWVLAALFFLMVACSRKRIMLAISLSKQTAVALKAMPHLMLLPVAKLALIVIVLVWWMAVSVALVSAGTLGTELNTTVFDTATLSNIAVAKKGVEWDDSLWGMWFYHLFGLLWTSAFVLAAMNFTLSSAGAQWYFTEGGEDGNAQADLGTPLTTGLKRAFGVHGGTLAFGSFLVATLESIRMIVDYLAKKAKKNSNNNKLVMCLCCIAQCCVRCFERCIKYITSEAYIFTALFGKGLCPSVQSTFAFIGANFGRVAVLHGIGSMIVFIAKLFVVGLTGMSTYALLIYSEPYKTNVSNPWIPLIIACSISYVVTCIFTAVFARTLDTLLVCFVADENMAKRPGLDHTCRKPGMSAGVNGKLGDSGIDNSVKYGK